MGQGTGGAVQEVHGLVQAWWGGLGLSSVDEVLGTRHNTVIKSTKAKPDRYAAVFMQLQSQQALLTSWTSICFRFDWKSHYGQHTFISSAVLEHLVQTSCLSLVWNLNTCKLLQGTTTVFVW
jgi:hypothetical protein